MSRAVSIHIGVNQPRARCPGPPLRHSEATAWKMAALAQRAGYRSQRVLQGDEATRQAVHEALTGAASTLQRGDILFVSFSGHGTRQRDTMEDRDERDGWDEAWCLADFVLVDDALAGYWRLFEAGVRILVVTESCYGGGVGRHGAYPAPHSWEAANGRPGPPAGVVYRGAPPVEHGARDVTAPCIGRAPSRADGIRASLLLLSACGEEETAEAGLFSKHLFDIWNNGAFDLSYCELYRQVHERVMAERRDQEPRILMLGAPDHQFSLSRAFHLDRPAMDRRYRYR